MRGGEWYLEKRGSRKILAGSRNLESVFNKSRSLVFAWFVFTFFESRNFLPKSLGLGFLTRISASRRVSDLTIRHPSNGNLIITFFMWIILKSSTCLKLTLIACDCCICLVLLVIILLSLQGPWSLDVLHARRHACSAVVKLCKEFGGLLVVGVFHHGVRDLTIFLSYHI